ncbi:MAG: DUF1345 domain-containing protein [Proteobacteria bacterium]|nr:DUF1345 domain-containing protein [Pseudomonadota bacterium]
MTIPSRAFHAIDPRGAAPRLTLAILSGVLGWSLAPASFTTVTRALIAWVAAGLVLLVIATVIIVRADADETRRRAAAHDPGRTLVWLTVLASSTLGLFAATAMIQHAKTLPPLEGHLLLGLSVTTVVIAWLLTSAAFTLRYAHLFYRGTDEGGLTFPACTPDDGPPDDLDFAYFAFTIAMCFQVSDVAITSREIRRTALAHAMLSFAYNTGIIALVLNIVIGQVA